LAPEINIIYGPPGTGKTSTLMDILDFEITKKCTDLSKIALVTFTKKGVEVALTRATEKFGVTKKGVPYFKTLHAMAFAAGNTKHDALMTRGKYYDFSNKMGMSFTGYYDAELKGGDDQYLFWNDLYRNNKEASKKMYEKMDSKKALFVMTQYANYKNTFGYKDFTDLIEDFVNNKTVVPVDVAIIDEAQDLTTLQWQMVWTAFSGCKRVYIAGDDDQAIYQWSGADVNCFLSINGHKEILRESWRLPNNHVTFSKRVSKMIGNRADKDYYGKKEDGPITWVNNLDEIKLESGTYLCLARNNVHLPLYEAWLSDKIMPYQLKGDDLIKAKDLEAITVYEGIRKNKIMSAQQEAKFSNLRKTGSSLNDPWYEAFNWDDNKILLMRSLIAEKRITEDARFNISTIHSVKGGEADHVVIMTDITAPVKEQLDTDPDSEHRVFYVAATRAKKTLTIVKPQTKYSYGGLDR